LATVIVLSAVPVLLQQEDSLAFPEHEQHDAW
jgi:hypothetical protein